MHHEQAVAFAVDGHLTVAVLPSDPDLSVLAVKRHAASRLPPYMVPTEVRLVQELPRTSSGKVDRVRLAAGPPAWPSRPAGLEQKGVF